MLKANKRNVPFVSVVTVLLVIGMTMHSAQADCVAGNFSTSIQVSPNGGIFNQLAMCNVTQCLDGPYSQWQCTFYTDKGEQTWGAMSNNASGFDNSKNPIEFWFMVGLDEHGDPVVPWGDWFWVHGMIQELTTGIIKIGYQYDTETKTFSCTKRFLIGCSGSFADDTIVRWKVLGS